MKNFIKSENSKEKFIYTLFGVIKVIAVTLIILAIILICNTVTDKFIAITLSTIVLLAGLLLTFLTYFENKIAKQHEKTMYKMAFTDDITGEGNKNSFILEAKNILTSGSKNKYALIAAGISRFRAINELYGKQASDEIIKHVFSIIKNNLPPNSICVRNYDAEFIILYNCEAIENIKTDFIDKITRDISNYNEKRITESDDNFKRTARLQINYGICRIEDKLSDINKLYDNAVLAKQGLPDNIVDSYEFYNETMRAQIRSENEIEDEMFTALKEKQFKMFLQPKFNLKTKELSGSEALVRWFHPEKGMIPPNKFIPVFEKNGFVLELDKFIWEEACKFLAENRKNGLKMLPISVNVSRIHMNNDFFINELVSLIHKYDIPPEYLEIEVTESASFDDNNRFKEVLDKLKAENFVILMDDFGTGYSSLNTLRLLPFDILKLDMGFIKDSTKDNNTKIIIESIVKMAKGLKMTTIAEGVETEEQVEFLRSIGCETAQGYYYGKPSDTKTFIDNYLLIPVN